MVFRWWADDGPFIAVFGSSILSSTKKNPKKHYQIWTPSDKTFWICSWKQYFHILSIDRSKVQDLVGKALALVLYQLMETINLGLSGRVLDSRTQIECLRVQASLAALLCVLNWARRINPRLVLVQPRKTCPGITEKLSTLTSRKLLTGA